MLSHGGPFFWLLGVSSLGGCYLACPNMDASLSWSCYLALGSALYTGAPVGGCLSFRHGGSFLATRNGGEVFGFGGGNYDLVVLYNGVAKCEISIQHNHHLSQLDT